MSRNNESPFWQVLSYIAQVLSLCVLGLFVILAGILVMGIIGSFIYAITGHTRGLAPAMVGVVIVLQVVTILMKNE